jgi:hypothetical protein
VKRAIVLFKADADDPNGSNEKIRELTGLSIPGIVKIRKRLVQEGFEAALERKQRRLPPVPKKLDGFQETQVIAIRCGSPPKGFGQWLVASVFLFVAPFANWCRVSLREHRTKQDGAEEIEQLVMHDFKDANKVTIVLDNLNTHIKGALYKRFPPEYCREILRRCEFVDTPVHGSGLNITESKWSVLTKQCLCRRVGSLEEVRKQVTAWTTYRNDHAKGVP